jgi:phage N-6-adenine-methyltransferase
MESRLPPAGPQTRTPRAHLADADGAAAEDERAGRRQALAVSRRSPPGGRAVLERAPAALTTQLELGFRTTPPPSIPSDERFTPQNLFAPLHLEHGFTLDVAATAENALCPHYCTASASGLVASWASQRVWCNPPWSQLEWWVEKAWREVRDACPFAMLVLPDNRTHQRWWQTLVEPVRDRRLDGPVSVRTRFLEGRVHFGTPEDPLAKRRRRPRCGVVLVTLARAAS